MSKTVYYKGYQIIAVPHPLAPCGEWTPDGVIVREKGIETKHRTFGGNKRCKTRDEAVRRCYELGKEIIDGIVERCTVTDL
jgi:hypothetical protein